MKVEYGGKEKQQHKIRIAWELFGEDEEGNQLTVDVDGRQMPMTISKSYTVSLHEKSSLRKDLAAWRGRDFTDEEAKAFDVSRLIGVRLDGFFRFDWRPGPTRLPRHTHRVRRPPFAVRLMVCRFGWKG